jgi:hypothetical protein
MCFLRSRGAVFCVRLYHLLHGWGAARVPAESGVQIRTRHGSLIGFLQWILWLFRRGGGPEPGNATPETPTTESVDAAGSASYSVNGNTALTKTSHESEAVLKSSDTNEAADATTHNEHVELTREIRSNEKSNPSASENLKTTNDAAVQTKYVQAFLERLPEIQRQLLDAETAPGKALAEFMAKLMPTKMRLRAPLRALRADYKEMDEMGIHRASERPESRVKHVTLMLIFIAVEAVINGSFLAVGSEGGLITGCLMALGISLFNVLLLGFGLGAMALRQLNHRASITNCLALLLCAPC